jgi:hypothetical protein
MTSNLLKYKAADLIHLIEWSYQTRMAEKLPTGVNRYMKIVIQQVAQGGSQSVEYWKGSYVHKGLISMMMFITDGHPVALQDILGLIILSEGDIADIRCFLVGLVTGDNWQYDNGDNSHKKMTGDDWQIDHGDSSHKRMT